MENLAEVEKIIGYTFKNKKLLAEALTHSSYANLHDTTSNERLEFLGDTVLSTIISEQIYLDKDYNEGKLSKLRAKIVSLKPLSVIDGKLGLSKYLRFAGSSKAKEATDSMKADLVEATIGAIYIDGGFAEAKKFVLRNFSVSIKQNEALSSLDDHKSYLQEHFIGSKIEYSVKKSGADHDPTFVATVYINGLAVGKGTAKTKRDAEQLAAGEARKNLKSV